MKLKCTIGSISCDGVLAEKGDIFNIGTDAGTKLIQDGYAVDAADQPDEPEGQQDEPGEEPVDTTSTRRKSRK